MARANRGRARVLAELINVVAEAKEVDVAVLAAKLGYSLTYLKYDLLPRAMAMTECLEVKGSKVAWRCGGS